MEKRDISDLAYILSKIQNDPTRPKPIVFLGAGASVSAGIPMASEIVKKILNDFSEKPAIKRLTKDNKKDYYQLMSALSADERRDLFSSYINSDDVKINVTHIYLAQLIKLGLIDYVFTPNFDDLLLKACALFNYIPPVYDISNFNDFTTTNFQSGSITYLHGQHHGQWLLNAQGELEKVKGIIPKLFHRVCDKRTWIVVGYSGNDEVLEELSKFESFDNELYWIGYKNKEPIEKVREKLLDVPQKNAFIIQGYDSDTFFLQLHSELKLETPEIFNKPFTFIKTMMENIKSIDEYESADEHKEKYEVVQERFSKSKEMVKLAIESIENDPDNKLIEEIIDAIVKKDYSNVETYYHEAITGQNPTVKKYCAILLSEFATEDSEANISNFNENRYDRCYENFRKAEILDPNNADIYNNWGVMLSDKATLKSDQNLYIEALSKQKTAVLLDSKDFTKFYNLGTSLSHLARLKSEDSLYQQIFDNYRFATELNPQHEPSYINWSLAISDLAEINSDAKLYNESFLILQKAIEINSNNDLLYVILASLILKLAKFEKKENLYNDVFKNLKTALELNPKNDSAYTDWGIAIADLAQLSSNNELYIESFDKFEKATEINATNSSAFTNWVYAIIKFSYSLNEEEKRLVLIEATSLGMKAYEMGGGCYNLACSYALLKDTENAFKFITISLEKKEVLKDQVLNDFDWSTYKEDPEFIKILLKY